MVRAARRSDRTGADDAQPLEPRPVDPGAGHRHSPGRLAAALGGRLRSPLSSSATGPITGRSLLGAALIVFAVGTVLTAHRAAVAPPGEQVVVLAVDARSGSTLRAEDLLLIRMELPDEVAAIPGTEASALIGSSFARDLQRGTVLTPSDVVPVGNALAGSIRITLATDPDRTPAGLRAGERVDVLSTDLERGLTDVLVTGATVTGSTDARDTSLGDGAPTVVELAIPDPVSAAAVVDASVRHEVTLVLPPSSTGASPGSASPVRGAVQDPVRDQVRNQMERPAGTAPEEQGDANG